MHFLDQLGGIIPIKFLCVRATGASYSKQFCPCFGLETLEENNRHSMYFF